MMNNRIESSQELSISVTDRLPNVVNHLQRSLVMVQCGSRGFGSGVIWRKNGIILTNNHVVVHGQTHIILDDGRDESAQVIDRDETLDLALLRINDGEFPVAQIADSRATQVGQLVFAVGHPWGERGMVTAGVISGLGEVKNIRNGRSIPIIRSDVRLAPGNSGGPLANITGGVIGVNTMVIGGDLGIAIPSHIAETFVQNALDLDKN
jgi:serine protease Do